MTRTPRLAAALVAVSLAAIGASVWTQIGQHQRDESRQRYEACSDQVLNELITTLVDTRQVAADERATTRKLYQDIARSPRDFQSRLGAHLAELDQADAERAKRPLPLPPAVACGHA